MNDETTDPAGGGTRSTAPTPGAANAIVSFCQQCGRALTTGSQRRVGAGIFCEPCAGVRIAATGGWQPVNADGSPGAYTSYPTLTPQASKSGEPNPILAGFLGLVPGVGAMYNGQYPKGAIHLVVFVVLVSLADNVNWVFWWFVWGWIFYQAFDAYHTAQARRDGQPLPDPFGWNELGERLVVARQGTTFTPPAPYAAPARSPAPPPPTQPPPTPPMRDEPTTAFTGFAAEMPLAAEAPLEPTAFVPPAPPAQPASAVYGTAAARMPYAATYTGASGPPAGAVPEIAPSSQRFPAGAAWLIGLGVLFLLGNLLPSWRLDGRWFVPVLLGGIATWIGAGRMATAMEIQRKSVIGAYGAPFVSSLAGLLLGPSLIFTVAILLGLQNASIIPLRHSWPGLLIVWGALLLVERSSNLTSSSTTPSNSGPIVPPTADAPLR